MAPVYHYIGVDVSKETLQISTQTTPGQWVDTKIENELIVINVWIDTLCATGFTVFE